MIGYDGNAAVVGIWRTIAAAIRQQHTNHKYRDQKLRVLKQIIHNMMARRFDRELIDLAGVLTEVIDYLLQGEYLTHSDVKDGLWLFDLLCEVKVDEWQTPAEKQTREAPVVPDDVGDLPF